MKFGLLKNELTFLNENLVHLFKNKGTRVFIFGSRARGNHSKFSDIDLMLESSEDLEAEIRDVLEFFEESTFPYKIDLIDIKKFSKAYLKNYLAERIEL